jgi:hypothetical protein
VITAEERKTEYAAEEQQLRNVEQNADFSPPTQEKQVGFKAALGMLEAACDAFIFVTEVEVDLLADERVARAHRMAGFLKDAIRKLGDPDAVRAYVDRRKAEATAEESAS